MTLTTLFKDGSYTFHDMTSIKNGKSFDGDTKRVILDKEGSTKPFGDIDVPKPERGYWGSMLISGWVLTPLPKTIPINGVDIYVDSVYLGKARYGLYRGDVYDLFHECNNSNKAGFDFYMDTNRYANGMHFVNVNVTDNDYVSETMGWRYFEIHNKGSLNSMPRAQQLPVNPICYSNFTTAKEDKWTPVKLVRGFVGNLKEEILTGDKYGKMKVKMKELDRMVIYMENLKKGGIAKFEGYIKTSSKLYPLPIGSTLDGEKGIFYWQPGTGFVGDYKLVFIGSEKSRGIWKKIIDVKVTPKLG